MARPHKQQFAQLLTGFATEKHGTPKHIEFARKLTRLLRKHGVNTLLITGINTNSCVLATVCAANVRDYAAVVIEDCVDTMDGANLHQAALLCIKTAFGWVMPAQQALAEFSGADDEQAK